MSRQYNASDKQVCKLCGKEFIHNKQGRFTSHLKNEHNLFLDEYLINYFYTKEDLTCSTEGCNNQVKLRRGVPNKYCSKGCAKRKLLVCEVCGKEFFQNSYKQRACSKECGRVLAGKSIAEWHKNMSEEEKKEHFRKIIEKTASTRRKNKTPSWNSGKTGIYSEETIERMREAALRNLLEGKHRKTSIEKITENILKELGVNYKYSFILGNRQFDFVLPDYNVLIECDGDFWHCNPRIYSKPNEFQRKRMLIDLEKNKLASANGYFLLRFWETDIKEHTDDVKEEIERILRDIPQRSRKRQA